MNYRKKPVVIQAVQFTGQDASEIYEALGVDAELAGEETALANIISGRNQRLTVSTLEGILYAEVGNYIIKGVKGELYPCKPDIFEETYDLVDDEPRTDN